jgi:hypothetical protein
VGQCASADHLWLTALNQLQPTYVRCPEGKPSWPQTACLIKAGTLLNIWLYFITGRTRDCGARSGKLCVLDLRLDQKIDGASGCLHSCMAAEAQGDTMEACARCTARLYNLVWTSFALRTLA